MKIVEEYRLIKIEHLVNQTVNSKALASAKNLGSDCMEIGSTYVETKSWVVRDLTAKEHVDDVVRNVVKWWEVQEDVKNESLHRKPVKTLQEKKEKKTVSKPQVSGLDELLEMAKGM